MPRARPDGNKFLAEVEELLNRIMGFPNGTLALKGVLDLHGGAEVYVPTATEVYINWRNTTIVKEFRGDNYLELSLRHGFSVSQVRRIVKQARRFSHLTPVNEAAEGVNSLTKKR